MPTQWTPIADFPDRLEDLSDGELIPLARFWADQRLSLQESGVLGKFTEELARRWAIETGQIEGVYDLDRGTTETLIERGISAELIPHTTGQLSPELTAAVILDHLDVLTNFSFDFVKGIRPLSKGYIHELHAALLQHQDSTTAVDQFGNLFKTTLQKGRYKSQPNNPRRPDGSIHVYCPVDHVDSEMDRLIEFHNKHESAGIPVEIQSAWLHHRFTQIHPYQDGNGRVARTLASLLFIRASWFPAVVTRDDRTRYLDALEVADQGDLRVLVVLLVDLQKRSLFQATQAVADSSPVSSVNDAISAIKNVLTGAGLDLKPKVWLESTTTADQLLHIALARLREVAAQLSSEIKPARPDFEFIAFFERGAFRLPELDYKPNLDAYRKAAVLSIKSVSLASLSISAHGIGSTFRGLLGIVATYNPPDALEGELSSDGVFQVNYTETAESAELRFRPWLERAIVQALVKWRKSL